MAETVELATILLTDVVESTRLAADVGPVGADELREEHFGILREALSSRGGHEIKNTGDGLMVAFSSASAAVECAVVMQQLIERRYRGAAHSVHLRIGLGAGEAMVKDADYFGTPVVEAARLCDKAETDGILVSGAVRMLAGRCEGVEFGPGERVELKGFREPAEAFAVSWQPLAHEAWRGGNMPLPAALRSEPAVAYVGRARERATLEAALAAARGHSRQIALIAGEPGIGKTRLAGYAAHSAHAQRFAVCWGACAEDFTVPYEPWIEICSQLVEWIPQDMLDAHVLRHRGELQRLAPNIAARVSDLPPPQESDTETERYLLFSAVVGLLTLISERVALCVVIDDLHHADAQSVALLRHLVRSGERGAMLVVGTYRDSDINAGGAMAELLADMRALDGYQRISLEGLTASEVAEMLTAISGHELDDAAAAIAADIAGDTGGNPFFVGEILRGLAESGDLAYDPASGRWKVDRGTRASLPESVREVIERRVARLGPNATETLRLAAVIGHTFEIDVLAACLAVDEGQVLDLLERAVSALLLSESAERVGEFSFAHALINQTLYQSLGPTRRARSHQRVAEAIEARTAPGSDERLSELAMHWRLASSAANARKAAVYSRRAGQRALAMLAPTDAARLFAEALELAGDEETAERCAALIGLGAAKHQIGDRSYRETLLEASQIAYRLRDAELAAQAALTNSRGSYSLLGDVDVELVEAIERALELDDPPLPARRARLLALEAQELEWGSDLERRRALADEAVRLARQSGDERALGDVLLNAYYAYWTPLTHDTQLGFARELTASAASAEDPGLAFWTHVMNLNLALEASDEPSVQRTLGEIVATADALRQPILSWVAAYNLAGWALLHERLPTAVHLVEQAFELGQQAGEPDAVFIYGAQLASLRTYQGRGEEILGMIEQSVATYPDFAGWHAALAHVYGLLARTDEAAAIVRDAAAKDFKHVASDQTATCAFAMYADAAACVDLPDAAEKLYALIEPWSERFVWNGAAGFGHARMWLGILASTLGRHELADEHMAHACDVQERGGTVLWATYAHLRWGEALAARGEPERAHEHARRAFALARDYGYGAFEGRSGALVSSMSPA